MGSERAIGSRTGKDVWGPKFWSMLHMVSFLYCDDGDVNKDMRTNAREFVHAFARMIPCPACQQEFIHMLQGNNPSVKSLAEALKGRADFTKAVYEWHDYVNRKLDKQASPPFSEVERHYQGALSGSCPAYFTRQVRTLAGPTCKPRYDRVLPTLVVLLTCAVVGLGTMYNSCRRRCGAKCSV